VHAALLWALHTGLSVRWGRHNGVETLVCLSCLAATLLRFHSRHDLFTALAGAATGMIWELPCTASGAWRFPDPQILGLVPAWLPAAYAVFFVNLGRVGAGLAASPRAAGSAPC
jgi:hypothetical protein